MVGFPADSPASPGLPAVVRRKPNEYALYAGPGYEMLVSFVVDAVFVKFHPSHYPQLFVDPDPENRIVVVMELTPARRERLLADDLAAVAEMTRHALTQLG